MTNRTEKSERQRRKQWWGDGEIGVVSLQNTKVCAKTDAKIKIN